VLFDSPLSVDQVAAFASTLSQKLTTREPKGVRQAFIICARLLAIRLQFRLLETRRLLPLKPFKLRVKEIREKMKDTPFGQMMKVAEERARAGDPEMLFEISQTMGSDLRKWAEEKLQKASRQADTKGNPFPPSEPL
jgi:hypothetical protein